MRLKRNIVCVFLLFLFTILITSISYAKESIVDYYNSIPLKLLDNYKFQLQYKNNIWISRSETNREIKPIVDIKNGYLKITDAGTGGGVLEHELALYRTHDGSDIVGAKTAQFDGVGSTCSLKFYKPSGNQWMDITNDVLPKIDLSFFMNETYKLKKEKLIKILDGISFLYQLPRIGTTMNVKIELDRFIMSHRGNDDKMKSGDKEIISNIKYQEIELLWDDKNSKFNFGKKKLFVLSNQSDLVKNYLNLSPASPGKPTVDDRGLIQQQDGRNSPPSGDPERKAILDALRKHRPNSDDVFVVRYLKVDNGWAWIHVVPQSRDGSSQYEDESWLLQKLNGQWILVESRSGECGDDPDCSDDKIYFRKLKSRFPSVPVNIFPY